MLLKHPGFAMPAGLASFTMSMVSLCRVHCPCSQTVSKRWLRDDPKRASFPGLVAPLDKPASSRFILNLLKTWTLDIRRNIDSAVPTKKWLGKRIYVVFKQSKGTSLQNLTYLHKRAITLQKYLVIISLGFSFP